VTGAGEHPFQREADRGANTVGPSPGIAPYVLAIRKGSMTVCAPYWRQANTAEQVKESP
jgi:hypothetical protein